MISTRQVASASPQRATGPHLMSKKLTALAPPVPAVNLLPSCTHCADLVSANQRRTVQAPVWSAGRGPPSGVDSTLRRLVREAVLASRFDGPARSVNKFASKGKSIFTCPPQVKELYTAIWTELQK